MLIEFFNTIKKSGVNVSLKELLDLIKALDSNLINRSTEDFYYLSRSIMVKDEKYYDKFDKAFGIFFEGIENLDLEYLKNEIPEEWLRKQFEKSLTKEQKDKIKSLGDLEELMKKFMETFNEQGKDIRVAISGLELVVLLLMVHMDLIRLAYGLDKMVIETTQQQRFGMKENLEILMIMLK